MMSNSYSLGYGRISWQSLGDVATRRLLYDFVVAERSSYLQAVRIGSSRWLHI